MNWWVVIVPVCVVLLGYVASRAGWIDLSDKTKRSGSGPSILGIGDEVFAPTRHEAAIEMDRQTVLPAPAPVAGDGDKGVYSGHITIDVDHAAGTAGPQGPSDRA
ncbi:MAG: hypothetical protein JWQ59_2305 [Cryobacterium sp.]|jgi:hypothetical protein|nr:hypothetical protein [Cryobacterium sp.]